MVFVIGNVEKHQITHYFKIPSHAQSMIAVDVQCKLVNPDSDDSKFLLIQTPEHGPSLAH